jgi:hypothetical protein
VYWENHKRKFRALILFNEMLTVGEILARSPRLEPKAFSSQCDLLIRSPRPFKNLTPPLYSLV